MNELQIRNELNEVLTNFAAEIDVPPLMYEQAKERYETVCQWLDQGTALSQYKLTIYPQGSFALGTVIRPIGDEDYDVDAVCRFNQKYESLTQKELKTLVGDRLKQHGTYAAMLDPREGGRRCWTLQYADESRFHLDILPAIPDDPTWLTHLGVPIERAKHAIRITDQKTWDYAKDWPKSNPSGYVIWFNDRMKVLLMERREALAMEKSARVEEIKDYEVIHT